ncbi:MAG: AAA family ATPase [Phycisphaerae bacterium]|nr:AAA family ATPase [Phycisphaerae bacterium]
MMLTRIHVDNFRCLVNFDLKFDRLNLLLGSNGSGKTAVFEVLRRLQGFIAGDLDVATAFPSEDLTRWQQLDIQRFELEMKVGDDVYLYTLSIQHFPRRRDQRVKREDLRINQRVVYEFDEGSKKLSPDNSTPGQQSPVNQSRSGIPKILGAGSHKHFRYQMHKLVVVRPCPPIFAFDSEKDNDRLTPMGENFPSWYRFVSKVHSNNVAELTKQLREAITGFDSLEFRDAGRKQVLKVGFRSGAETTEAIPYAFNELSDGQRQMIMLYTLLYGVKGENYTLFLDEPDNYLALREIQPWVTSLQDVCGSSMSQAVLISHNPEIIDYLAGSSGRWFDRPDNGPTRVYDTPPAADGLTTSETIARGWTA